MSIKTKKQGLKLRISVCPFLIIYLMRMNVISVRRDIFRDLRLNGADVGQTTVYRVLNQLEKRVCSNGIILRAVRLTMN